MFNDPLQEAVELIGRKQYERARIILEEMLERDQSNEFAWLWLSACSPAVSRQRYCLQRVLLINPENPLARARLNEIRSRVDEPTLDDVLGRESESLSPSMESARWARYLLTMSGELAKPQSSLRTDSAQPAGSKPVTCPRCHAGQMTSVERKHHSSASRTLSLAVLSGFAVVLVIIVVMVAMGFARGNQLIINDWFYKTAWQPLAVFVLVSAVAFAFFRLYLNRSEVVSQCSHCGHTTKSRR